MLNGGHVVKAMKRKGAWIYLTILQLLTINGDKTDRDEHLILRGPGLHNITRELLATHNSSLKDLSLVDLPDLEALSSDCLEGFHQLTSLYIWNAPKLLKLPKTLLQPAPVKMRSIRIMYTGLQEPPDLGSLADSGLLLHIVDLEGNKIQKLPSRGIRVRADQLIIDDNDINEIEEYAFEGSELAELSLRRNKNLKILHELSFAGIIGIRELDVSSTSILFLPVTGLGTLEVLRVQDNTHMKTIPSIYDLQQLRKAWLTHHFHCCAFEFPELHNPQKYAAFQMYHEKLKKFCSRNLQTSIQNTTLRRKRSTMDSKLPTNTSNNELSYDLFPGIFSPWGESNLENEEAGWTGEDADYPEGDQDWKYEDFGHFHQGPVPPANFQISLCGNLTESVSSVECWPRADPLNPCTGVLGSVGAHVLGWIVGVVGSAANLLVAVVLLLRSSSAPARLLHVQLAIADLCTAGYVLLLACVDAYTSGSYFNYAYDWQYGVGCQIAGFLGVAGALGSLLALASLTLERWLAITRALLPNSRLSPRAAIALVIAALVFSLLLAAMPLLGLSDYSSTSVCLPMRQQGWGDSLFLWIVLLGGMLSIAAVAGCYIHIYVTLARDTKNCTTKHVETSIANKMAILILTHMACVLPVGVAGAGALAGHPALGVQGAKLLLVLVYPLNALADPFLYAILTHHFRKDLCLVLARFGLCQRRAEEYKVPGGRREHLLAGHRAVANGRERTISGEGEAGRSEEGHTRSGARSLTTGYEDIAV